VDGRHQNLGIMAASDRQHVVFAGI
jgi:hypothetical protein